MEGVATWAAVVLAGGTAARLDGVDKAGIEHAGRTLLEHALAATAGAAETVVVGAPVPTSRPVTFTREDPPLGGPAAAVLAGVDALAHPHATVAVLAVDMPRVGPATFDRLRAGAEGHDGAFLVDGTGRRALAGVLDHAALHRVRPDDPHGLPLHRLLATLELVEVAEQVGEATDVDTWEDLRRLEEREDLRSGPEVRDGGSVNLHDWIDELCDALDVETEVDEGLVLDLARTAAHNVTRPAAPITTYLLGVAAGSRSADPAEIERLAARAQALAEGWDRPRNAPDPDDVDDDIPDDTTVDHSSDVYDESDA